MPPRPFQRTSSSPFRIPAVLLAAGLMAVAGACRDRAPEKGRAPSVTLTVSAAASLREAVAELDSLYGAEHPEVAVRANFGASGALRQQIEQGAPVDVFISASESHADALQRAGLIDPRTRRVLAGNELVLVVPAGSPSAATDFRSLASPAVKRVAIGAAASVPAGEYADEVLRSLGIADAVGKKAVYGQNVRQVLAYVESGNVDAGIVYRTDAAVSRRARVSATAPAGTHRPITYPLAVIQSSAHRGEATAYAAFLLGPRGRDVLARHGFTSP
ncbi:MAG TPA: molybdate ABC transporter substrate-binding protein [Longimicrobium sp.]|nr:molybdate ABC transporter substrate-binding protein [Longimicrobium sp.]